MGRKTTVFLAAVTLLASAAPLFSSTDIPADHPSIQYFGRWDFTSPLAPAHSWPGVYIRAGFEGTSIGVKMNDNYTYYNIFIDGMLYRIFKGGSAGMTSYPLASGLPDGNHVIIISKRCETTWTKFSFGGFVLDDGKTLLPPEDKPEKKIEFIGDSFTSASGNEATTIGPPPDVSNCTNVDEGFAAITAGNYGAQYTLTSRSGFGVVMDWVGNWSGNLPDVFGRTHIYTELPEWDFGLWVPNLVVIGLGLNDYSGFGGYEGTLIGEETDLYKTRYHEFIAAIRDVYQGVKILCVAAHLEWMQTTIAEIVDEENLEGNGDVFYADYPYYEGGYVNSGHPNVATHHAIAGRLIAAIDGIDAWTPYDDTLPPSFTSVPLSPFTAMYIPYELNVTTDSYATVRWSAEDRAYADMENTFTTTGQRSHCVEIPCEQGETYTFYLRAADLKGNAMDSSAVIAFTVDTMQAPINWTDIQYPLNGWNTLTAPIGFGFADAFVIPTVNAAYFRHYFTLGDPASVTYLSVKLKYDDGAVVYLNGTEFRRVNMPGGDVIYDTRAQSSQKGYKALTLEGDEFGLLVAGTNLLAVEIHQADDAQSDLYFECRLVEGVGDTLIDYGGEWSCYAAGDAPKEETKGSLSPVDHGHGASPNSFCLEQNYPNPFNPSTLISYSVPRSGRVVLDILDLRGRVVAMVFDGMQGAGRHQEVFDGSGLASGEYFCRLRAGETVQVRKMVLLK